MTAESGKGYVVVVPVLESDIDSIFSTQTYWAENCPPFVDRDCEEVDLVYFFNCGQSDELTGIVQRISERTGIGKMFRTVRSEFADLDPEIDIYIREKTGIPPTEHGLLSGPNEMFFRLVLAMEKDYEAGFLMEVDCVPVKPGWCRRFVEVAKETTDPWVIGSRYHGWSWLPVPIQDHINGNAIYRFGDPAFQAFVEQVWIPRAHELIHWGYADLAYDCFPKLYENLNRGPLTRPDIRSEMAAVYGRFCESPFIVNLGGAEDDKTLYGDLETIKQEFSDAWIIHAAWLAKREISLLSDPEFALEEKETGESADSGEAHETPDHFVKFVWVAEDSWMFGNRFSLGRKSGKIFVGVLVDRERVHSIELQVDADREVVVSARKWTETVPSGFLIGGILVKIGKKLGLARGLGLERFLRSIRESISHVERATGLGAALHQIRVWFHQMKGRKLGKGINRLEIPVRKLGRSGVCFEVKSVEEVDVKGEFTLIVNRLETNE